MMMDEVCIFDMSGVGDSDGSDILKLWVGGDDSDEMGDGGRGLRPELSLSFKLLIPVIDGSTFGLLLLLLGKHESFLPVTRDSELVASLVVGRF